MATQHSPEISRQQGVTVVALGPAYENLDEPLLADLRSAILEAARSADPPRLVLDLSHTEFFGSAFIEVLVEAWRRVNDRGDGRFALAGVAPYCADVLRVTRLDRLWTRYATRDEAVRSLAAG